MLRRIPTLWASKLVIPELYPSDLNPISKSVIERKLKLVVVRNETSWVRKLIVQFLTKLVKTNQVGVNNFWYFL